MWPASCGIQRDRLWHVLDDAAVYASRCRRPAPSRAFSDGCAVLPAVLELTMIAPAAANPVFLTLRDAEASIDCRRGRSSRPSDRGGRVMAAQRERKAVQELLRTTIPCASHGCGRCWMTRHHHISFRYSSEFAFAGALICWAATDGLRRRIQAGAPHLAEFGEVLPVNEPEPALANYRGRCWGAASS